MISEARYRELKGAIAMFDAWRGNRTSYYPSEVPEGLRWINNDHRSEVEVFEFVQNQPDRYFAYVSVIKEGDVQTNRCKITTWTGQILGYGKLGRRYYCRGFGRRESVRYPIRFTAINGITYSGTYYVSAGDYCRVRKVKCQNSTNHRLSIQHQ